eukprot:symbB.v1.2.003762.t1/scaffold207.1/size268535/9
MGQGLGRDGGSCCHCQRVSRAEEAQLSHLHAEALEESMRQDFLEETEYMERPDRPESDSTMASDMKEAKEGPLKSAMTSPESSKTPYQGKETARVRISLPESLTESGRFLWHSCGKKWMMSLDCLNKFPHGLVS